MALVDGVTNLVGGLTGGSGSSSNAGGLNGPLGGIVGGLGSTNGVLLGGTTGLLGGLGGLLGGVTNILDDLTGPVGVDDLLSGALGTVIDDLDLAGIDLSILNLGIDGLGGGDNVIPQINLSTGELNLLDLVVELGSPEGLIVTNGRLFYQNTNDALIDLNVGVLGNGSLINLGADISLGDLISIIIGVGGDDGTDPSAERLALDIAYENITRVGVSAPEAPDSDLVRLNTMANQIEAGTLTFDEAVGQIVDFADDTTSVATTTYQFFTDRIPTEAGLDFLVNAPDSVNPTDLNDPYYQVFNVQNRFINFAVNLGVLGEGSNAFAAEYGGLTLTQATARAYTEIFGSPASASHISQILNGQVPDPSNPGQTFARSEYFEYYGQTPLGTAAAMIGWLLAEGVNNDIGAYATANEHFLTDLADGSAQFNVNLIGVYSAENSGHIDFT